MSVIRRLLINDINKRVLSRLQSAARYSSGDINILKSPYEDVHIPKTTLPEFIFEKLDKWPNRVATECGITGRKYTYSDIRSKSVNLSKCLRKTLKLQSGDIVAVILPNCPEFPIIALGSLLAGLTVTTVNPAYTPDEICRQLKDSSAKVIFTFSELYPIAKQALDLAKMKVPIVTISTQDGKSISDGAINFKELCETKVDVDGQVAVDTEDIAFLPYSSGTTGLPKGVLLSHRNIIANLCQINHPVLAFCQETTADHQDVIPAVLPQFHIYGLTVTMFHAMHKGCKIVTLPKFTPESYVSTLINHKPHVLFVAPPMVMFLTSHPSVRAEYLSSIRCVISGAAPLGARDEEKFVEKAQKDIIIRQGFGMTETSPAVAILSQKGGKTQGSIGTPVPNTEVKIINPDNSQGDALGPNQTGELLVRGPQVMKGYHNRPEETEDAFVDGWLRTGDMVFYDEDKLLFVTDRLKELIKVKGFQVPPAELEEIVRDFPGVADAGVIGIIDAKKGELPRAYVVPKPGVELDVNKLKTFVAEKVAPYKQLAGGVAIVDSIPKSAAGKILRRQLKLLYEAEGI